MKERLLISLFMYIGLIIGSIFIFSSISRHKEGDTIHAGVDLGIGLYLIMITVVGYIKYSFM